MQNTSFAKLPRQIQNPVGSTAIVIRIGSAALEIKNGAEAATVEDTLRIIKDLC